MNKSDLPGPQIEPNNIIARIEKRLFPATKNALTGYVYDHCDPERRFTVELVVDGFIVDIALCRLYSAEAFEAGFGDACYGFVFTLTPGLLETSKIAEVRLANLNESVGEPILLNAAVFEQPLDLGPGFLSWPGGLRFSGWVPQNEQTDLGLKAFVDGELVAQPRASGWAQLPLGGSNEPVASFEFDLPEIYADGRPHQLSLIDSEGDPLRGSPLSFIAFEAGLSRLLAANTDSGLDAEAVALLDHFLPQTIAFAEINKWMERYPNALPPNDPPFSLALCLIGEGDLAASLASVATQAVADWVVGALPSNRTSIEFETTDLGKFLSDAREADVIVFAPTGVKFELNGIRALVHGLNAHPDAEAAYCDIVFRFADNSLLPLAFPAFDSERSLEQGYMIFCFAMRKRAALAAVDRGADNLYSLFQQAYASHPVHVPCFCATTPAPNPFALSKVLARATGAHLRKLDVSAEIQPLISNILPAVRIRRKLNSGPVSIVIPTGDDIESAKAALANLRRLTPKRDVEFLVVVGTAWRQHAIDVLHSVDARRTRILSIEGAHNLARCCNRAAELANGEFVCFVSPHLTEASEDWLDELIGRLRPFEADVAGALLCSPDQYIVNGGFALSPLCGASPAFANRSINDLGYGECARIARECSAVSFECGLMRRDAFRKFNGMDETRFPRFFHDVDLCLRLRSAGKRIIFTPHARVTITGARGKPEVNIDHRQRYDQELWHLRQAWSPVLVDDPFYSPLLGLGQSPFTGLAWPPRQHLPRLSNITAPAIASTAL